MPSARTVAEDGRVLLCSCFNTMDLNASAQVLSDRLAAPLCQQLCREESAVFENALAGTGDLLVACTQEAPLFDEIASEHNAAGRISYVNIRETAGWTTKKQDASAKVTALLENARWQARRRPAPVRSFDSDGLCLVYGAGQQALDAALKLEDSLSVTLVLTGGYEDILLPATLPFPVFCGKLHKLGGSLGAFEVVLNAYAPMMPSSRSRPEFLMPRDGARSSCSIVVDLSGETAPLTAPHKRDGYIQANPESDESVTRALNTASGLVGSFEKPIYVTHSQELCAHSHAGKTGCSNCLDACPAGAISSQDAQIRIDPGVCGGCSSCATSCPTGAISPQYPYRADLLEQIQGLLGHYQTAGGTAPVLLVHGTEHGMEVISALARFGDGLPGHVLPLGLHAPTGLGHEAMLAAFLAGARQIIVLCSPQTRDELAPLQREADLACAFLDGFGHDTARRIEILCDSDPDSLAGLFSTPLPAPVLPAPQNITAVGGKRDIARLVIEALQKASAHAPACIPLPDKAPYGQIQVTTESCTLCLACVSACPTGAISDNPDRPQLGFVESACVQCGLCRATCPEKAITLEPRYNSAVDALQRGILHEEEPATCTSCGKAFGTRSTIARIKAQLAHKHHMFASDTQASVIEMCDDCRISAQWNMDDGLMKTASERPRIRTTDDYVQAGKAGLTVEDFLKDA